MAYVSPINESGDTAISLRSDESKAAIVASMPKALRRVDWEWPEAMVGMVTDASTYLAAVRVNRTQNGETTRGWDFQVVTVYHGESYSWLERDGEEWGWEYEDITLLAALDDANA